MAKISVFGMNVAYQLGFERIMDVRGVRSISHLFKKAEFLSGIYLQIRPGNHAYIGKTYNLPARFEQHIARGVVIEELAFKPMRANIVDKMEKQFIALAERKREPCPQSKSNRRFRNRNLPRNAASYTGKMR